jgi:2-oxoglutarate ferredoxin oxidoreductase subunit alpha
VVDRLALKHKAAALVIPESAIYRNAGAAIGIVGIGGCDRAIVEAVDLLAAQGVDADYLRVRSFPFPESVGRFLLQHETVFVVEQNRDAQLRSLLISETAVPKERLRSILVYGGFPLSAASVVNEMVKQLEAQHAVHQ